MKVPTTRLLWLVAGLSWAASAVLAGQVWTPEAGEVEMELPLFEALARGYLEETGSFLTAAERGHLVLAGRVITLEQGVRFLTDFLSGDSYYRTQRAEQNLDRCRTQFKLVESIVRQEEEMSRFIESL